MPLERVLVAVFDCRIFPPVMVSPFDEVKLNADMPPAKVEVAVVVAMMPGTVVVP